MESLIRVNSAVQAADPQRTRGDSLIAPQPVEKAQLRLVKDDEASLLLIVDLAGISSRTANTRDEGGAPSAPQFDGGAEKAGRIRALPDMDLEAAWLEDTIQVRTHE